MKRIITLIYFFYVCVILVSTFIIILPFVMLSVILLGKYRVASVYFFAKVWFSIYSFLVGLFWKDIGTIKPDPKHAAIFVANHDSYYDILAMTLSMHQPYRILGKEEMTKIPIFGYLYGLAVITVNRKSDEDRRKSVERLKYYLAKNISIYIFPEGTFNNTNHVLKPFYDGAFRIALETNTPIQPVVFFNCKQLLTFDKPWGAQPGIAKYKFLPIIPIEQLQGLDVQSLKALVFEKMETELIKYKQQKI